MGAPQDYYWPNERYCAKYSCGPVGSINVIFGSSNGLTGSNDRYFRQNSHRVGGRSWVGDLFGAAVAIGDINGDGYGDVVVGSRQVIITTQELSTAGNIPAAMSDQSMFYLVLKAASQP